MTPERYQRIEEVFGLAIECEAIARRDSFAILLLYARGQRGVYALWRGDAGQAVEIHREVLAKFWELKYRFGVAAALDDLACSLGASGSHRAAMRTAGAATRLRDAMGISITPQGRSDLDLYLGPARQQLGEEAAAGLFAEGRAMALEDAVGDALVAVS